MKKVFVIPAAIFAIVFLLSAIRLNSTPNKNTKLSSSESYEMVSEPIYILKEYKGSAAVVAPSSPEPQRKLPDMVIDSLPEYDRSLL